MLRVTATGPAPVAQRRLARPLRQPAIFTLALLASALVGACAAVLLWPDDHGNSSRQLLGLDDTTQAIVQPDAQRRTQHLGRGREESAADPDTADDVRVNFPRRVQTVRFTPPPDPLATSPSASLPEANPLAGKALRYLIGTEASGAGGDSEVTMVSYSASAPVKYGISIAYCNLFDELNTGRYGPYLHTSDTAAEYGEGQIDPRGPGWEKNLREQFERRKRQGFEYVELDNADAYSIGDVIGAIELAAGYGLKVIAKNPGLLSDAAGYVAHPNVYGVIVEKGGGGAADMDELRQKAGKPDLPVWFVAFGSGRAWATSVADAAKQYRNMGVTYSSAGEYGNAIDILPPS
jgi:hypothetical protein